MALVADVKCYYCGFISGEMVSPNGQSMKNGTFRPGIGVPSVPVHNGALRCARCGGPVFLDDLRTEKAAQPPFVFERERPGRPRRVRPAVAGSASSSKAS
ncbi:MAG TPA: hypothetical protein VNG11_02740 [Chloroflexota bacterium]|nr:hypothetical protein [Chloroflexota bacterium]